MYETRTPNYSTHRCVQVGRGLVVGVRQHGDDRHHDGLDRVDGKPSLRSLLVAPLVLARRVQDGDAHLAVSVNCLLQDIGVGRRVSRGWV